jgi:hypothetical protein
MELNADCSPDLSNDRRQNDVAGNRKIDNDGVVFDAQHWADAFLFKGSAAKLLCPRESLARSSARNRSPSIDLCNSGDLVELTGIEPVTSCLQSRRSPN